MTYKLEVTEEQRINLLSILAIEKKECERGMSRAAELQHMYPEITPGYWQKRLTAVKTLYDLVKSAEKCDPEERGNGHG